MEIGPCGLGAAFGQGQGILAFEPLVQQVADGAVGRISEGQGNTAGGIEPLWAILVTQSDDALTLA